MCTIREHTNSFAALCNLIRELSNSIKELSNMANTPAIWKIFGITLESSAIELESFLINWRAL